LYSCFPWRWPHNFGSVGNEQASIWIESGVPMVIWKAMSESAKRCDWLLTSLITHALFAWECLTLRGHLWQTTGLPYVAVHRLWHVPASWPAATTLVKRFKPRMTSLCPSGSMWFPRAAVFWCPSSQSFLDSDSVSV
jgi:hypothetical protein